MAAFNLTPPVMAKMLQDTWRELGGNPGLAPPAAWMEVGTVILNKIVTGLIDVKGIDTPAWSQWRCSLMDLKALALVVGLDPKTATIQDFLTIMHRDLYDLSAAASDETAGLLADAIKDQTPIEVQLSEPKPLLYGVPLVYDFGGPLLDYLRGTPWQDTKRIVFGKAWGASTARDPLLHEVPAIRAGERHLIALLPTDIEQHPGERDFVSVPCDFCNRTGLASMKQMNDKADSNGFCICPPCIARLVGASWPDSVMKVLWGKDGSLPPEQ